MNQKETVSQNARNVFSRNLRFYLESQGKTQLDLAIALGVTTSTASDWANGKKYPRVNNMQAIADWLGVLISDLREDKPAAPKDDRLSTEEEILLREFRAASKERQSALLELLRNK